VKRSAIFNALILLMPIIGIVALIVVVKAELIGSILLLVIAFIILKKIFLKRIKTPKS